MRFKLNGPKETDTGVCLRHFSQELWQEWKLGSRSSLQSRSIASLRIKTEMKLGPDLLDQSQHFNKISQVTCVHIKLLKPVSWDKVEYGLLPNGPESKYFSPYGSCAPSPRLQPGSSAGWRQQANDAASGVGGTSKWELPLPVWLILLCSNYSFHDCFSWFLALQILTGTISWAWAYRKEIGV